MDEVFKSELSFEHDHIVHKLTQPTEDIILERNKRLRSNPGVIKDLQDEDGETWGRLLCNIPMIIWNKAIKDGFDLNCRDGKIAKKELMRFLQTDIGKACLVREQNGNKNASIKVSYFSKVDSRRYTKQSSSVQS